MRVMWQGDGIYEISYIAGIAGKYALKVLVGQVPIAGESMPYRGPIYKYSPCRIVGRSRFVEL